MAGERGLPLLTRQLVERLRAAARTGEGAVECSLDLGRSTTRLTAETDHFIWNGQRFAYPDPCRDRTIYHLVDGHFTPLSRYDTALIKLVPTEWGPPTFEIDGIKMLPTAQVSPWEDARRKVQLIAPRGKAVLDCCGGLGYFAAWCLEGGARQILSFEKNADVLWLRALNPWSPAAGGALTLVHGDVLAHIDALPAAGFDAVLHDPPRFGIAGELYSLQCYTALARVLRPGGRLFHYTGTPNRLSSGRDLPREVAARLQQAGFDTVPEADGILATRRRGPAR